MAIDINVLKGSSSIGGNKILLHFDGRNVLFDFGYDYSVDKLYFDSYTNVRQNRGIHDHLEFGMLPKLGIYRKDLVPDDCAADYAGFPQMEIDALFISHAHMDHIGMAGFLDSKVPFVATAMTLALMKAIEDTSNQLGSEVAYVGEKDCTDGYLLKNVTKDSASASGRSTDYLGRRLMPTSISDRLEDFLGKVPTKNRKMVPCQCQSPISLGFDTKCFDVDHSIYGAAAFAVNTSEGWVVYTGDLRSHGVNGNRTEAFAEEARKLSPRVLIIEGTRASRQEEVGDLTEMQVENNCLEACTDVDGLIVADFGPRNFERLEAFARIASSVGRDLVITVKDSYFLDAMRSADGKDRFNGIKVLRVHKERRDGHETSTLTEHDDSVVTLQQVRERPNDNIICFSNYDMPHLLDVKPKGGLYIYSGSGSFDEEQDHDFERLDNWIRKLGMRKVGFEMVEKTSHRGEPILVPDFTHGFHASGHASKEVLKELVEKIKPEYLIPVHTQNPRFFTDNISSVPVENILLPEDGKVMKIE